MRTLVGVLASLLFATTAAAAITATKTVAVDSAAIHVTYQVIVNNSGPDPVAAFVVDNVPVTITNLSAVIVSGGGSVAIDHLTGNVWWTGVSVPAGSNAILRLEGSVRSGAPAGTVISNQATVQYDSDGNGSEDASTATNVAAFTLPSRVVMASLQMVVLTPGPIVAGSGPGNLVYRITITASSSNERSSWFTITDNPTSAPGFTIHSAMPSPGGSWDPATRQWTTGWLSPGESATLDLAMTVAANAPSQLENSATVTGGAFDFVASGGSTSSAIVTVTQPLLVAPVPVDPLALLALALIIGAAAVRVLR